MSGGSCRDLRDQLDSEKVQAAFSALVSGGKFGYKTVIERKKDISRCAKCSKMLEGGEKFCPECGHKL
jgi:rRNA maturation endonuclease Nob1